LQGFCDVEQHVAGVIALHDFAVQPRLDFQPRRSVRQVGSRDKPRSETAGTVKVLPDLPLIGTALLTSSPT
jgi:hypothetical protein